MHPPVHAAVATASRRGHHDVGGRPSLQKTPRAAGIEAVAAVYLGHFRWQMTVVEIIITELHCFPMEGTALRCRKCATVGGALSETVAMVALRTEKMLSMFWLRNKKCSETGPNRRCSGPEQYQKQFRYDL